MDIQRDPAILRRKKIRQALVLAFVGVGVVAITAAVMQLEPAAPTFWFERPADLLTLLAA